MIIQQQISTLPFKQWLLHDKENKRLLWLAVCIMVVSFTWLKIMYPFPNFMPPDSKAYIDSAVKNEWINIWSTGYSRFLRQVSIFTNSHLLLVMLQYILLQISVLYFLLSLRYLLSPPKWLFRVMLFLIVACPLLPHIANFVSSDGLFTALSLVWFTQLLWIIANPNIRLLLWHSVVLLLAFMVRFNALYYPFISVGVIVTTHLPRRLKLKAIGAIAILLSFYIGRIQYEYYQKTGSVQFAAFSGWQIAANALYGYAHADHISIKAPMVFEQLHALVNQKVDSLKKMRYRPDDDPGVYYMWNYKSPLIVYLKTHGKNDPNKSYFQKWATVAPLYARYGQWLIINHPKAFIQYYAWPNLRKYYYPPTYFMGKYNMGKEKADSVAGAWFGWKNNYLPTWHNNRKINIIRTFPLLMAIVNPLFLLCGILFLISTNFRKLSQESKKIIWYMLIVWIVNTLFSVLAAPIELRYLIFPFIITVAFGGLFGYAVVRSLLAAPVKQVQLSNTLPKPAI
jgi:hypothetical protein